MQHVNVSDGGQAMGDLDGSETPRWGARHSSAALRAAESPSKLYRVGEGPAEPKGTPAPFSGLHRAIKALSGGRRPAERARPGRKRPGPLEGHG
jgi:hypothetical protein